MMRGCLILTIPCGRPFYNAKWTLKPNRFGILKQHTLLTVRKHGIKFFTGKLLPIESILTRYITAAEPDFKIGYAPYPVNEKGETNYMHGAIPNSFVGVCDYSSDKEAAYAFAKFCATYGNKYMYAAGHAGTWKNVDHDEVLNVVFGSKAEAEKWIDTDSYIANVIAKGQPAYAEDYIVAFLRFKVLSKNIQNMCFW